MSRKQKFKPAVAVANRADDPYITSGAGSVQSDKFWRWGDDNLFPNALALMARRSVTHRRIINDKADYISGKDCRYPNANIYCCLSPVHGEARIRLVLAQRRARLPH